MDVLLDTGVLLRLVNPADPQHVAVRKAVRILYQRGDSLVTTPQNVAEFWNVSTRPAQARGGQGRTLAETERCIRFFESFGAVLPEHPATYTEWKRLVITHGESGTAVHDARIAALMAKSNLQWLLTLNQADFVRYPHLTVMTPDDVLAGNVPKP